MKYIVLRKMFIYAPSCASLIQFPPLLLRFHYPVNTFLVPEYARVSQALSSVGNWQPHFYKHSSSPFRTNWKHMPSNATAHLTYIQCVSLVKCLTVFINTTKSFQIKYFKYEEYVMFTNPENFIFIFSFLQSHTENVYYLYHRRWAFSSLSGNIWFENVHITGYQKSVFCDFLREIQVEYSKCTMLSVLKIWSSFSFINHTFQL